MRRPPPVKHYFKISTSYFADCRPTGGPLPRTSFPFFFLRKVFSFFVACCHPRRSTKRCRLRVRLIPQIRSARRRFALLPYALFEERLGSVPVGVRVPENNGCCHLSSDVASPTGGEPVRRD